VTIATVAEAAGVSVATVSRVVRDHADVREATRVHVLKVIDELGFRPSPLARALVSGQSLTLGLVISDITNPFYPQLAKSVEQEAAENGLTVLICNTDDDPEISRVCMSRLLDQRIGGLIHGSIGDDEADVINAMGGQAPIVFVNRRPTTAGTNFIVADNALGARQLTEHLLDQGHRRIGFIAGPEMASNARERLNGFLAAMEGHADHVEPLVSEADFSPEGGREHARRLLANRRGRPTALIGVNDMVAMGAMEAVIEAGLRVPEDVAVAGFDNTAAAASPLIGLTSVAQHIETMGRAAVKASLRLARRKTRGRPITQVIEPELLVRRTTLAPVADPLVKPAES
jgi:LacI family transcriptional regulator